MLGWLTWCRCMMKGCALHVRMFRMSASQASRWGDPRCRKEITTSCPMSSSLHSSVRGLALWLPCSVLKRLRLCSRFSFLYLQPREDLAESSGLLQAPRCPKSAKVGHSDASMPVLACLQHQVNFRG